MEQFERPILFLVFKRLDTTKKVFEQIRKIKPKKLYVASDGPRNKSEEAIVLQVREFVLNSIDWNCELKTRFREKNLGLGFGVNDAINWFFSEEEAGIILEDDCMPSISFFRFCDELLDLFRDDKKIGIIQGFNPFPQEEYPYSYFFSRYNLKWGWATWKDRWQYQDMYTTDWPEVKKSGLFDKIFDDKLVKMYWETVFDLIHRNPHLTWDFQFDYQMLKRGLLAVVPKKNLILNIGFGREEAINTKWDAPAHMKSLQLQEITFPLIAGSEINKEYDRLVETVQYQINWKTVLRLKLKNVLDSNPLTRNVILPALVRVWEAYKSIRSRV